MTTNNWKNKNWFWPLIILGGGLMLLLKAFGIGEEYQIFQVLGSILLLSLSISSLIHLNFFMFLVPLSLIVYLWRIQLGLGDVKLILLLIGSAVFSIGLSLIFRSSAHSKWHTKHANDWKKVGDSIDSCHNGDWSKSEETLNENENVTIDCNFSEQTKYIHAGNLKRVQVNSSFASTKVYFDQVQVSPEGLEINVAVSFSGVILVVPKNWLIESRVSVFAGAVKDETHSSETVRIPVKLNGTVNLGEVKIISL